ncbi:MAG: AIR synthase-related protein, partial [Acetobacterales bacterium]
AAAGVLRAFAPSACTDVSGFGLAGHLLEMLRAGDVGARLDLAAVPLLDGAVECVAAGMLSSLHSSNLRFAADAGPGRGHTHALMFDPQTAGGLLAALPAASAERCLDELRGAGYPDAAIVGTVTETQASRPTLVLEG